MGKKSLKQILATLLAASMLAPTAAALSEQEDATPANPSTTIEAEVTAPSIEDLCLTEEFIAFLNQNNIPIVDGNISPATVDDFRKIVQYYQKAFTSKGIDRDEGRTADFTFIINFKYLTPELIKKLIDEEVIYPESIGIKGTFMATASHILQKNRAELLNGNYEQIANYSDMVFSIRGRRLASELDKMVLEAREFLISGNKEGFLAISDSIYLFVTGQKNLNEYSIKDSEDNFLNAYIAISEIVGLSLDTGLYMDTDLFKYFFAGTQSENYAEIKELLEETLNNSQTLKLK